MRDGSLDGDGVMNVCVCDVKCDVMCDVRLLLCGLGMILGCLGILMTDGRTDGLTDICTSRVAFATENRLVYSPLEIANKHRESTERGREEQGDMELFRHNG